MHKMMISIAILFGLIATSIQPIESQDTAVIQLSWNSDGTKMARVTDDPLVNNSIAIEIVNFNNGEFYVLDTLNLSTFSELVWSPTNPDLFAVSTHTPFTFLYNTSLEERVYVFESIANSTASISWSGDGEFIAVSGNGISGAVLSSLNEAFSSVIEVWNINNGTRINTFKFGGEQRLSRWKPHGDEILVAYNSRALALYSSITGDLIRALPYNTDAFAVQDFIWHPTQNWVAVLYNNWLDDIDHIIIWNTETGEIVKDIAQDFAFLHEAIWSPDGGNLAVVDGNIVRIFNIVLATEVTSYSSANDPTYLDWHPMGGYIAYGSSGLSANIEAISITPVPTATATP
jgi:hypothetical protein